MSVICDCILMGNTYQVIKQCDMCINRNIRLKNKNKNVWETTKLKIYNLMKEINETENYDDRLNVLNIFFEYILTCNNFLAYNPNDRIIVINKIIECKNDERLSSLSELFDKLDKFFINLKNQICYQN